jgi:hypothetical protein
MTMMRVILKSGPHEESSHHHAAVARQLVDVGKSLSTFTFKGTLYLSRTVDETMKEAEAAFSADDFDRASHLVQVVKFLVARETPKFKDNPQRWADTWRELQA